MKKHLYFFWVGLTLSSLFFFPLISSLNQQIYFFHWKNKDFFELLLCWLLVGFLYSFIYFYVEKIKSLSIKLITISIIILPALSFYLIQITRIAGLKTELIEIAGLAVSHQIISLIALLVLCSIVFYKKKLFLKITSKVITVFSFLNIFFIANIINIYLLIEDDPIQRLTATQQEMARTPLNANNKPKNIYFLVFDELSYQYLYEDSEVKEKFASIKKLASDSTNYHLAFAPGSSTMQSMPSYIAGMKLNKVQVVNNKIVSANTGGSVEDVIFSAANIFKTAKALGYKTALIGWYHDYCSFLYQDLDYCRAYSLYKHTPLIDEFSLLNPIATNLGLLPYQKPFWYLKSQAAISNQINTVKKSLQSSLHSINTHNPSFQLFHFSIPHTPFIYDGNDYIYRNDAYSQNDIYYNKQLLLVDKIVGQLINELKVLDAYNSSTIILTSDHNYRAMFSKNENFRVPLIIKPHKTKPLVDDFGKVYVQDKLIEILVP